MKMKIKNSETNDVKEMEEIKKLAKKFNEEGE